jgi:hypothetical protein
VRGSWPISFALVADTSDGFAAWSREAADPALVPRLVVTYSSDSLVIVRRLDEAAECAGLIPSSIPAPVQPDIAPLLGDGCHGGMSDGTGHVAVAVASSRFGSRYQTFFPDGMPSQQFLGQSEIFPQSEGWQTIWKSGGGSSWDPPTVDVVTFGPDGSLRRREPAVTADMWSWAAGQFEDPLGGTMIVMTGSGPPYSGIPCTGHAFRFSADGAPRPGEATFSCDPVAAGVSNQGESLVLDSAAGSDRWTVNWFNPDGTAAVQGEENRDLNGRLVPMLDGSLVLKTGLYETWTRRFSHLAPASEPAPEWLAARPHWRYRFTRGNQGYALFSPTGQWTETCEPTIELRAPSGRLCGTIAFTLEGISCPRGTIDQGWDGTVVQQLEGVGTCQYRWWPRLLQRE